MDLLLDAMTTRVHPGTLRLAQLPNLSLFHWAELSVVEAVQTNMAINGAIPRHVFAPKRDRIASAAGQDISDDIGGFENNQQSAIQTHYRHSTI